jgi:hypothetical protein
MSDDTIEEVTHEDHGGWKAEIKYDTEPQSPKDWDQLGTLVTWHRRGHWDEDGRKVFGDPSDFLEQAKENNWRYIAVGAYEHGGITIFELGKGGPGTNCPWDSGQIGYIYTTPERSNEIMGKDATEQQVREALQSEIKTWDQYMRGEVYGVVVKGPDGEERESCWGMYGFEYAKEEAARMLAAEIENDQEEETKISRMMAL